MTNLQLDRLHPRPIHHGNVPELLLSINAINMSKSSVKRELVKKVKHILHTRKKGKIVTGRPKSGHSLPCHPLCLAQNSDQRGTDPIAGEMVQLSEGIGLGSE